MYSILLGVIEVYGGGVVVRGGVISGPVELLASTVGCKCCTEDKRGGRVVAYQPTVLTQFQKIENVTTNVSQ